MSSLVAELKKQVLDEAVAVSVLLRKALLVAKELHDEENAQWIRAELKGYSEGSKVPAYRTVFG